MSQLKDFSVNVHTLHDLGFQADLIWDGSQAPFARFCAHQVEDQQQELSLFVVDDAVSRSEELLSYVVEQMARIMKSQLNTNLAGCTILRRIDIPDPPIEPEARKMRISRSGESEISYRLIIRSLSEEDFEAKRFDENLYRNVAVAECIIHETQPQITIIMQDLSLMTEPEAEGLARWLAQIMKWPTNSTIDILRGQFVVHFQAESE